MSLQPLRDALKVCRIKRWDDAILRNEIRIIGGKWRSRKIAFPAALGLRPTHDRIRETLFNWVQPMIEGAVCLDAFAGSGALGFEALSRGAKKVCFYEINSAAVQSIQNNIALLKAENALCLQKDFLQDALTDSQKFDLVFFDPPFADGLLLAACKKLTDNDLLNKNALVYLEFKKNSVDLSSLLNVFEIIKHKDTQTIEYVLCRYVGD